jgi:tetratricopeptide (TPR) repeat protein
VTDVVDLGVLSARFEAFAAQDRGGEAVDMLEGQAAHHADQADYWILLGRAFVMEERYDDAEDAGRRAVALAPSSLHAQITLLLALLGRNRPDEAVSLSWFVVEQHAEEAQAHYWVSRAHSRRRRDRQDLVVAHQAARHALSLHADSATFAQAARAASALGNDHEARELLAAGLAENPQDRDLLLLSGRIKGGERVVGPREELIGGILRQSPLDRSAEADLASSALRWLKERLFQLWYSLLLVAFVAALPLTVPLTLFAALTVVAGQVVLGVLSFRRLEKALPGGYLREQLTDPARGRRTSHIFAAAQLLLLLGSILVAVVPGPATTAGDVLLVVAAVVTGFGLLSVDKALVRLDVLDHAENRRDEDYLMNRWSGTASSYRRYWLAVPAGMVLMMTTAITDGDATGGAGMLSVGILWTIKTVDLIWLTHAFPRDENPWVEGLALIENRERRGNLSGWWFGARYILTLLLVCAFTSFSGFGAFIGGFVESASRQ